MTIFVTGASGFVASHLVPMLIAKHYPVTALIRSKDEKFFKKAKVVVGDLAKKGTWQEKLKDHDVLIHLAAEISSKTKRDFIKNNVRATENLIVAAKKARIKKIILFSSAAVTSIRQDWYAQTKKTQEELILASKIPYVILRPSMIYGPGDTKNIGWLIGIIKKLPIIPLPGGGHFGRQPVYVGDICKIVIKLLEGRYQNKIFEIHGKEYVEMSKMVKVITDKLGQFKIVIPIPLFTIVAFFYLAQRVFTSPKFTVDQIKSLISGEKFTGDAWWETFDIIPTSFESGVSKMIKGE